MKHALTRKHIFLIGFIFLAFFFWFIPHSVRGQASLSKCELCHSDMSVRYEKSAHRSVGISCVTCHGGNPATEDEKKAHKGSFRSFQKKKTIMELCASCHADAEKMKPYRIPIDQYALYLTSRHGKALLQGDESAAVCTDCHMSHEIYPVSDPRSSVSDKNVVKVCSSCHGDKNLMAKYKISTDIPEEFRQSVHGIALLQKDEKTAPDCADCHGAHGATPPGVGDVATICGRCHEDVLPYYRQSVHAQSKEEIVTCTECHGSHRIEKAAPEQLVATCKTCHEEGTKAMNLIDRVERTFRLLEEKTKEAKTLIAEARDIPLDVTDYESRIRDAWTEMIKARTVFHSLDMSMYNWQVQRTESILEGLIEEIPHKIGLFREKVYFLGILWFYILVSLAVSRQVRREIRRRSRARMNQHEPKSD